MLEWLTTYWPAILVGVIFGALFSLVKEFLRRFVFSAVLFLMAYKAIVSGSGHIGVLSDHELAGSAMLGIFLGCLVRPGSAEIVRKIASMTHSGQEM